MQGLWVLPCPYIIEHLNKFFILLCGYIKPPPPQKPISMLWQMFIHRKKRFTDNRKLWKWELLSDNKPTWRNTCWRSTVCKPALRQARDSKAKPLLRNSFWLEPDPSSTTGSNWKKSPENITCKNKYHYAITRHFQQSKVKLDLYP